ncbi:MAG: hypothetical protein MUP76_11165 [Acidimicrobiia bacterium]|nr:hypothetical protein [Acidimicrobiia bacterium]
MDRIFKPQARTGPTKLAFHASRIIIDAGVLISMAAMSMPFVTAAGAGKDSVAADALPVLILLAPIFLVTLLPDLTKAVPAPLGWASLVLGAAAFPYAVVKYLDATNIADTLGGSVGFGARLLIFGTFVTIAGIGIGLARNMLKLPSGGTHPAGRPTPGQATPRTPQPRSAAANPGAAAGTAHRRRAPHRVPPQQRRVAPAPQPRPERPGEPGRGMDPGER